MSDLDNLSWQFFRVFARCEYCLKAVGLREPQRKDPTADWGAFAAEIRDALDAPASVELAAAVKYYLNHPPKKQAVAGGNLVWKDSQPDHKSQAELILRLVCRVRNNLFHGGKFNGHWFEPQRSEELLQFGITILMACVDAHPKVRKAYSM